MRLRSLAVQHWRGLEAVALTDLQDGINLVVGPNEAGKSRLFQALHYALFESHKGGAQHKKDLQSWAHTEPPSVRLCFEHDGVDYTLEKRYLKQPMAMLAGGGRTLQGEDAETALRALLQTRQRGTSEAKAVDLGIWPLLMVKQGESRAAIDKSLLHDETHSRLQQCLSTEIGEAAISPAAQALLGAAQAECARYYTDATARSTGVLRDAEQALAQAQAQASAASDQLQQQRLQSERVAEARVTLADLQQRLPAIAAQAEAAQVRAGKAAQAQMRCEVAQTAQSAAQDAERVAQRAQHDQQALRTELDAAEHALLRSAEAQQHAAARVHASAQQRAVTDAEVAQTGAAYTHAQQQWQQAQLALQHRELLQQRDRLDQTLHQLRTLETELQAQARRLAALPKISAATVKQLRSLQAAAQGAQAKLEGAAVRVRITALADTQVNDAPLARGASQQLMLIDDGQWQIGTLAQIHIAPGGGELVRLRSDVEQAQQQLAQALLREQVSSLEQAEACAEQRQRLDQQCADLRERIVQVSAAPQASVLAERDGIDDQLAQLPAIADNAPTLTDAQAAFNAAHVASTATSAAQQRAVDAQTQALVDASRCGAEHRAHGEVCAKLRARLAELPAAEALAQRFHAAQLALVHAQDQLQRLQADFEANGGAVAAQDAQVAQRALTTLQQRIHQADVDCATAGTVLASMLQNAPFETLQDADGALSDAQNQFDRISRRAQAAKLLRDTLLAQRRALIERLSAPVIARVRPYLAEIFPGAQLAIDDALHFAGLKSGNIDEPFVALSGGAQEQLSLLIRIGLAEVLAAGAPLPLVLDDALVNTDAQRIAMIQRALNKAARGGLQVLLFSCHDALFDTLGAARTISLPRRRLHGGE